MKETQEIRLNYAEWCEIISEGYKLGCKSCQFIGGEPFLYRDGQHRVLDLAEHAQTVGYEFIEIFTNGTLITEKFISRIQRLGLSIAISLYSHEPDVHDKITRTPGSHAKTMAALNLLHQARIPTRVAIVGMSTNENTLPETITFLEKKGFGSVKVDPLRPKGRGSNMDLMPSKEALVRHGVRVKPDFTAEWSTVAHYATHHSCLSGKICITETGNVLPCIFSRDEVVGNVKEAGNLESLLTTPRLQRIWNTTKDDVIVCQDCEYRYVCFDCRPLSEGATKGELDYFKAPDPRCSYNPYTGEWGEGLWTVTKDGPVYNREYAEIIREVHPSVFDDIEQSHEYNLNCSPPCNPVCNPTFKCSPDTQCNPNCSPPCGPILHCNPRCSPNCSPSCSPCFPGRTCQPDWNR